MLKWLFLRLLNSENRGLEDSDFVVIFFTMFQLIQSCDLPYWYVVPATPVLK